MNWFHGLELVIEEIDFNKVYQLKRQNKQLPARKIFCIFDDMRLWSVLSKKPKRKFK